MYAACWQRTIKTTPTIRDKLLLLTDTRTLTGYIDQHILKVTLENSRRWYNVALVLGRRRRHWASTKVALFVVPLHWPQICIVYRSLLHIMKWWHGMDKDQNMRPINVRKNPSNIKGIQYSHWKSDRYCSSQSVLRFAMFCFYFRCEWCGTRNSTALCLWTGGDVSDLYPPGSGFEFRASWSCHVVSII